VWTRGDTGKRFLEMARKKACKDVADRAQKKRKSRLTEATRKKGGETPSGNSKAFKNEKVGRNEERRLKGERK